MYVVSRKIGVNVQRGVRTGNREAKSIWVFCKKALEYCRFTRTRGTRYNDWAVALSRYQVECSATSNFASWDCNQK